MRGNLGGAKGGVGMLFKITESIFHEIEADSLEDAMELFNQNPYYYEVGRELEHIGEA